MPYHHIEEIQSRKSEKIAMFLTIENAMGLILAALPAYLISANFPFVLRILVVGAAALLGIVATLEVGGMTFYERVVWRVRGALRQRVGPRTLTPDQLIGSVTVRRDRPLAIGGPIQLRPEVRQSLGRVIASTPRPARALSSTSAPIDPALSYESDSNHAHPAPEQLPN